MLPTEALEESAAALLDYQGKGFGIAEVSHRGKEFDGVVESLEAIWMVFKELLRPIVAELLKRGCGARQLEVEFRRRTAGGERRWIASRGQPTRDQSGEVVRVTGVSIDVTTRRRCSPT